MARAGTSNSAMAVAAATATMTPKPTTWPVAIRRARRWRGGHHGHGDQRVVEVGADEGAGSSGDLGREAGQHRRTRQPSGLAGDAGPNGRSPRRVTRWAKRGASP